MRNACKAHGSFESNALHRQAVVARGRRRGLPHCGHAYHREAEMRCVGCDASGCRHCVVVHREHAALPGLRRHAVGRLTRMTARAIWKGSLLVGEHEVPVKLYSAVEDRTVHFKLLHAQGPDAGRSSASCARTAARWSRRTPSARPFRSTTARRSSCSPMSWRRWSPSRAATSSCAASFRRAPWATPGTTGRTGSARTVTTTAYFALAQALADRQRVGIARWVMRRRRYVGALTVQGGYLAMTTLRRAEQVLSLPAIQPDKSRSPTRQRGEAGRPADRVDHRRVRARAVAQRAPRAAVPS